MGIVIANPQMPTQKKPRDPITFWRSYAFVARMYDNRPSFFTVNCFSSPVEILYLYWIGAILSSSATCDDQRVKGRKRCEAHTHREGGVRKLARGAVKRLRAHWKCLIKDLNRGRKRHLSLRDRQPRPLGLVMLRQTTRLR
jgi:hypothetical protein